MSTDVCQLLKAVGLSSFRYQEVTRAERLSSAAASWCEQIATRERPIEGPPAQPSVGPQGPLTVALVSIRRGAGRTTLAANLGDALASDGHRVAAMDLTPAGTLGGILGSGTGRSGETGATPPSRFRAGVRFVPLRAPADIGSPWESGRLDAQLRRCAEDGCEVVVLDTPDASSPLLHALHPVQKILCVLNLDDGTPSAVAATEALLREHGLAGRASYVVNRFDGRRPAERELLAGLTGALGERLLPLVVQADPAVQDVSLAGQLLLRSAADSQTTADIAALAEWLVLQRLGAPSQVGLR